MIYSQFRIKIGQDVSIISDKMSKVEGRMITVGSEGRRVRMLGRCSRAAFQSARLCTGKEARFARNTGRSLREPGPGADLRYGQYVLRRADILSMGQKTENAIPLFRLNIIQLARLLHFGAG